MGQAPDFRFNVNQTYTRDEFICHLEAILVTSKPEETSLIRVIKENLEWARRHTTETVISFEQRDQIVYPVAHWPIPDKTDQ